MIKYWTPSELKILRRLREGFLNGTAGNSDYWRAAEELALYDTTFAERIGWKWDGALSELTLRQWSPQSRHILDWGCGTGIASRRILEWWPGQFQSLSLYDRSQAAMRFAAERAHREYPKLTVRMGEKMEPDSLLVLSHVINELTPRDLGRLLDRACEAKEIIWVEAGARDESRRLSEVRDRLLGGDAGFVAVAPCTHQAKCGMLSAKNEQHWCHHFAHAPSEIFQSASWHQFSLELGIDLRSLPYSFLVLQKAREATSTAADYSRLIGKPREFKGHDKVLSCHEGGVAEFMLQKRDAPELMKALRKGPAAPVYRWIFEGGKIVGAEEIPGTGKSAEPPE